MSTETVAHEAETRARCKHCIACSGEVVGPAQIDAVRALARFELIEPRDAFGDDGTERLQQAVRAFEQGIAGVDA